MCKAKSKKEEKPWITKQRESNLKTFPFLKLDFRFCADLPFQTNVRLIFAFLFSNHCDDAEVFAPRNLSFLSVTFSFQALKGDASDDEKYDDRDEAHPERKKEKKKTTTSSPTK